MTKLAELFDQPKSPDADPSPVQPKEEPENAEKSVDKNGDGEISPEELFSYFDTDGDGKISMDDYAAHILFHLSNPESIKPHLVKAAKNVGAYQESIQKLHSRLEETLMVSDKDPQKDIKVKNALNNKQDVDVVDSNKINQLKLKENFDPTRYKYLAGI